MEAGISGHVWSAEDERAVNLKVHGGGNAETVVELENAAEARRRAKAVLGVPELPGMGFHGTSR
jgi:hypothetical protein